MASLLDRADREALTDLFYAYAEHFDRNEPEAAAELFTDDAVIDYGPEMPAIRGRRAVLPAVKQGLDTIFAAASHHITNVMLRADGEDGAAGTAYLFAWVSYRSGAPDARVWGQYHCRFRRTGDGWRIVEMKLKAAGSEGFHRTAVHPIGRRP